MRVALAALAVLSIGAASEPLPGERDGVPDVAAPEPCVSCEVPLEDLGDLFSSRDLDRLRGGEILVVEEATESAEGTLRGSTRASALVPRPPREVWTTLTDFESWPGFMPLIDGSEIARREGDQVWVRQHFSVLFVDMRHTSVYDLAPRAGELRWALDKEEPADIEASEGRWRLVPVDEGSSTLVRYEAVMSSGRAVPAFVQDILMRRSLRKLLASLRTETERRHARIGDPE
jgi:ribosome-associated toxin RatA of RatAB toxin-antitoxin module